jgi:N-acyl-L-homoserine lactone synthetase
MTAVAAVATTSFSDRIFSALDRVDYRRVETAEELDAICRLRYDAYLREGAIAPDFIKRLGDRYDELDNTWLFGVHIDGELASSFRLHVAKAGQADTPAMEVFPEFLKSEIEAGKTILDPTRFVADWTVARRCPELPYLTVRLGYMAAEYFGADFVLASVRTEHQAFYKRVFGHHQICPPRQYLTLTKPLSLMTLHYPSAREKILRRHPFFRSSLFERRMLFERKTEQVALERSAA